MGRPAPAAVGVSDTRELLEIAEAAARGAGDLLRARFGSERALHAKSTPTDMVSEADLASERLIRELLARERPEDGFLGEEGGSSAPGASGLTWVVDPLDGTINFLFAIPQWCVSVAVEDADGALAGVIWDPMREELFVAARGGTPQLNGHALSPSSKDNLSDALVATGFAYDARVRAAQATVMEGLIGRVRDIRRLGSAALDLAWTAAGRYDAYFERTVKPWDIAAGRLICRAAGLEVCDLPDRPDLPYGILAAPAALTAPLLELVG